MHQVTWSSLLQVMASCLTAPDHYLNQCQFTARMVRQVNPSGQFLHTIEYYTIEYYNHVWYTIGCRYNAVHYNMILHHCRDWGGKWIRVWIYMWECWEKFDHVLTAPHCIQFQTNKYSGNHSDELHRNDHMTSTIARCHLVSAKPHLQHVAEDNECKLKNNLRHITATFLSPS